MVREGTQMQQAGTEACCQGNGYTSHGVLPWPFRQRRSWSRTVRPMCAVKAWVEENDNVCVHVRAWCSGTRVCSAVRRIAPKQRHTEADD